MNIQCRCGKTISLDDSGAGTCGSCGYAIAGSAAKDASEHLVRKPRNVRKVYHTQRIEKKTDKPKRPITSRISARIKLAIRGEKEGSGGCLGCGFTIILVILGVLALDYYFINPPEKLPCSHTGHSAVVFNLLPLGHSCDGLEALKYIKRVRSVLKTSSSTVEDFTQIETMMGEDIKSLPYDFEYDAQGETYLLQAQDDGGLSYFVTADGTVHYSSDKDVDSDSPVAGSLGE